MRYQVLGPREAARLEDELLALWRRAFAEPPYGGEGAEFSSVRTCFRRHLENPGFRLVLARVPRGLVGFAYGFFLEEGGLWAAELARVLGAEALRGAFGLGELAVDPAFRGQGVGARLHDRLLAGVEARLFVLTVHRRAPALGFYLRRGWRPAGQLFRAPYLVLVR